MGKSQESDRITITGVEPPIAEKIRDESDELDQCISEYAKLRLRVGMHLFNANGRIDGDALERLANGGPIAPPESINGSSDTSEFESNVTSVIKANLSNNEPTPLRSEDKDDIVDIVINQVVQDALSELMARGEIKNVPGEGYQRNE